MAQPPPVLQPPVRPMLFVYLNLFIARFTCPGCVCVYVRLCVCVPLPPLVASMRENTKRTRAYNCALCASVPYIMPSLVTI